MYKEPHPENGALRFDRSFSIGHILIGIGLAANAASFYFSDRSDTRAAVAVINAHVEQLKRDDVRQSIETKAFRDEVIAEFRLLRAEIEGLRKEIAHMRIAK